MRAFLNPLVACAGMAMMTVPAMAGSLASIDAYSCGNAGTSSAQDGYARTAPEVFQLAKNAGYVADAASTVKVRIIYEMGNRTEIDHCGGTVIDSNWIVTAAHCLAADSSWDRIEIVLGDQHLDGPTAITRTAHDAVCHAGFRYETLENDIALIRLDKPLPARITPMPLDGHTPSVSPGEVAEARGWPVTGMHAGDRMMHKTSVKVLEIDPRSYITVASEYGSAAGLCRGESGGPLVSKRGGARTLAGVLSGIEPGTQNASGDECMLEGYHMYFTPISSFRGWIENVRSSCAQNPAACDADAGQSMMLADAGTNHYDELALTQPLSVSQPLTYDQPIGVQYAAAPAPQPVYHSVDIGYAQPSYAPQPAPQPVYHDVTPKYVHTGTLAPTFASAPSYGYQPIMVAHAQPASQHGYVDSGLLFTGSNGGNYYRQPADHTMSYAFLPGSIRH